MTLYDIRSEHLQLIQQIEEADGELTPEIEQALSLTQEQFQEKAISYGYVIKKFEDNLSVIEKEIERLQDLKNRADKKRELFKQRLSDAMQQFGFEKITGPLLSLSFRKSESIDITDEDLIPTPFKSSKVVDSISKRAIMVAIKDGYKIPGAELVTKNNLQIK